MLVIVRTYMLNVPQGHRGQGHHMLWLVKICWHNSPIKARIAALVHLIWTYLEQLHVHVQWWLTLTWLWSHKDQGHHFNSGRQLTITRALIQSTVQILTFICFQNWPHDVKAALNSIFWIANLTDDFTDAQYHCSLLCAVGKAVKQRLHYNGLWKWGQAKSLCKYSLYLV